MPPFCCTTRLVCRPHHPSILGFYFMMVELPLEFQRIRRTGCHVLKFLRSIPTHPPFLLLRFDFVDLVWKSSAIRKAAWLATARLRKCFGIPMIFGRKPLAPPSAKG